MSRTGLRAVLIATLALSLVPLAASALARGGGGGGGAGGGGGSAQPPQTGTGSVGIMPGGNGHGRVTSSPAGIDCTIAASGVTGPCQASFHAGIVVRLEMRPAADSQFQGWRGTPGCGKAPDVTVFANTNISCQPGLSSSSDRREARRPIYAGDRGASRAIGSSGPCCSSRCRARSRSCSSGWRPSGLLRSTGTRAAIADAKRLTRFAADGIAAQRALRLLGCRSAISGEASRPDVRHTG